MEVGHEHGLRRHVPTYSRCGERKSEATILARFDALPRGGGQKTTATHIRGVSLNSSDHATSSGGGDSDDDDDGGGSDDGGGGGDDGADDAVATAQPRRDDDGDDGGGDGQAEPRSGRPRWLTDRRAELPQPSTPVPRSE